MTFTFQPRYMWSIFSILLVSPEGIHPILLRIASQAALLKLIHSQLSGTPFKTDWAPSSTTLASTIFTHSFLVSSPYSSRRISLARKPRTTICAIYGPEILRDSIVQDRLGSNALGLLELQLQPPQTLILNRSVVTLTGEVQRGREVIAFRYYAGAI